MEKKGKTTEKKAPVKSPKSVDKVVIKAQKRTILGKAVRKMRKDGLLPANIFGSDMESISVSVDYREFSGVYKKVRATGILYVEVDSESLPCLISDVQTHPVSDKYLHVDFKKINMKKKTEVYVPVKIVGESPAVKNENGVLITQLDELTVETLPSNIPQSIEVDISKLVEIGSEIKVSDIKLDDDYKIIEEADAVIVSVTAHKEESVEPDTTIPGTDVGLGEKKDDDEDKDSSDE